MMSEKDILYGQVLPSLRRLGYEVVRFEQPFGVGSRRVVADAVAYDNEDAPEVLVEVKRDLGSLGGAPSPYAPMVQQAYRAALVAETPYFVVSDGDQFLWYRVDLEKGVPESIESPPKLQEKQPRLAAFHSITEMQELLWSIADLLRSRDGAARGKLGQRVLSLVHAKVCDELRVQAGHEPLFYASPGEDPGQVVSRLRGLYKECANQDLPLEGTLTQAWATAVSLLQPFSFLHTELTVAKPSFDGLIAESLRADTGQFPTPRQLVSFMVEMVAPRPGERVIDPVCGTGAFPAAVVSQLRAEAADTNVGATVYGIDIDPQLAHLARLNLAVGGGRAENVVVADSLDEAALEKLGVKRGTFDVVLAHPPGGRTSIDESRVLQQYELARRPPDDRPVKHQALEVLFVERCLQLLRAGGRLAILIPDLVLFSSTHKYVRWWLLDRATIDAVVSLPVHTLIPHAGARTSVLVLTKHGDEMGKSTFMAVARQVGYDPQGRSSGKNDLPGIAQEYLGYRKTGSAPTKDETWLTPLTGQFVERLDVTFYHPAYRRVVSRLGELSVPVARLEEIAETMTQGATIARSALTETGLAVVGSSQIERGRLDLVNARRLPEELVETVPQHAMLREGDLLISVLGDPGKSALVTDSDVPAVAGRGIVVVRPRRHLIDPRVLYLLFTTNWIQGQISMLTKEATPPRLTVSDLGSLLIPLPDPPIQNRIAMQLGRAHEARQEAQVLQMEALALLENYLKVMEDDAD